MGGVVPTERAVTGKSRAEKLQRILPKISNDMIEANTKLKFLYKAKVEEYSHTRFNPYTSS